MTLDEAKAEGQRWLDYLEAQKAKTHALVALAQERRNGTIGLEEARRQIRAIDDKCSLTVFDGARLAEAVKVLINR